MFDHEQRSAASTIITTACKALLELFPRQSCATAQRAWCSTWRRALARKGELSGRVKLSPHLLSVFLSRQAFQKLDTHIQLLVPTSVCTMAERLDSELALLCNAIASAKSKRLGKILIDMAQTSLENATSLKETLLPEQGELKRIRDSFQTTTSLFHQGRTPSTKMAKMTVEPAMTTKKPEVTRETSLKGLGLRARVLAETPASDNFNVLFTHDNAMTSA